MLTMGVKLKQLREQHGLSQADIAKKLHLSRQTISKWELGNSQPDLDCLQQLALFYQQSLDELFDMKDKKEQLIAAYKAEVLSEKVTQALAPLEITNEHEAFVYQSIISRVYEQLAHTEKVYWWSLDKQQTMIFSTPKTFHSSLVKNYWELFNHDASLLIIATNQRLLVLTIPLFLEEQAMTSYFYTDLDYLCVGPSFGVSSTHGFWLGIYLKDKHYNLLSIEKNEAQTCAELFKILDEQHDYFKELQTLDMITFTKKWRQNKFQKV
ncbi:hypothetical protein BAU15_02190 [Enterococcus sp. JM4C]|uniref:helix-turn-helix transcriptional regulator n=1 Tax=Candidatus Enterococcus huntleyi TaxID=1857217 RepID=UPI00137A5CD8|nr:helix-turn-helix domain-containing protein [Enterococcus sp. JM4C]KAF1299475.1 hypothetical protein BAU15_02190 [Enterococcus sp. JM4C]